MKHQRLQDICTLYIDNGRLRLIMIRLRKKIFVNLSATFMDRFERINHMTSNSSEPLQAEGALTGLSNGTF